MVLSSLVSSCSASTQYLWPESYQADVLDRNQSENQVPLPFIAVV